MSNTKETYKVVSTNFDESIIVTFDLVVDLSESELHEFNDFWAFSKQRLSNANGDIKQVFCHLYARQLVCGVIANDVFNNDPSANSYITQLEGFYPEHKVAIQNFYSEFDTSTKTRYEVKETQDDQ